VTLIVLSGLVAKMNTSPQPPDWLKSAAPKTRPVGLEVALGVGLATGVAVAVGEAIDGVAVVVAVAPGPGGEPQAAIKKIGKSSPRLAIEQPDAQAGIRVASGGQ
jgi:hypothetical protein